MDRRGFISLVGGLAAGAVVGSQIRGGSANALDPCEPTPTTPTTTAATTTAATTTTTPPPTGSPFVAYSEDSFFKSSLLNAPIDNTLTNEMRNFCATHPDQKGRLWPSLRGVGGNAWGTPYTMGTASDPIWKLTGNVPTSVLYLKNVGFHSPDTLGQLLTGTSDSPFVVIDVATGISIWAAGAKIVGPRTISVSSAGYFQHNSNGLDKRNPLSNSTVNFRSRGCIPDAMVIRPDLLRFAMNNNTGLGHVLHMFWAETRSASGFVHPMVGAEGSKNGWGAEGVRIAISPLVNLATRGMSPEGLAIARTLQQHGAYLGDNSGSDAALKLAQGNSAVNTWQGFNLNKDSLRGITWNDFVVIKPGWQG